MAAAYTPRIEPPAAAHIAGGLQNGLFWHACTWKSGSAPPPLSHQKPSSQTLHHTSTPANPLCQPRRRWCESDVQVPGDTHVGGRRTRPAVVWQLDQPVKMVLYTGALGSSASGSCDGGLPGAVGVKPASGWGSGAAGEVAHSPAAAPCVPRSAEQPQPLCSIMHLHPTKAPLDAARHACTSLRRGCHAWSITYLQWPPLHTPRSRQSAWAAQDTWPGNCLVLPHNSAASGQLILLRYSSSAW